MIDRASMAWIIYMLLECSYEIAEYKEQFKWLNGSVMCINESDHGHILLNKDISSDNLNERIILIQLVSCCLLAKSTNDIEDDDPTGCTIWFKKRT